MEKGKKLSVSGDEMEGNVIWFEPNEPIGTVTLPEHAILRVGIRPDFFPIHIQFPLVSDHIKVDVTRPVADILAFCCRKGILSPPASIYAVAVELKSASEGSEGSEMSHVDLSVDKPLKPQLVSLNLTELSDVRLVVRNDSKNRKVERSIVETLNSPPIYPEEPGECESMNVKMIITKSD
jgi:hypothetical protein